MGRWCLMTGQDPDTWHRLTRLERRSFINELNKLTRK